MATAQLELLTTLYEHDETAWLEAMARVARQGDLEQLDHQNLAEFLTDMARRDRREVESRLASLIAHLLKWHHQPDKRSRGWLVTAEQQRQELLRLLTSKTLRNHAEAKLSDIYADGVRLAMVETGLPETTFPQECPFTLDELLRELPSEKLS